MYRLQFMHHGNAQYTLKFIFKRNLIYCSIVRAIFTHIVWKHVLIKAECFLKLQYLLSL